MSTSKKVNRVIFDTCIYGLLARQNNYEKLAQSIAKNDKLCIYGCHPVRKELRKISDKKLQSQLLNIHDLLVKDRWLEDTEKAKQLAQEYYSELKKLRANAHTFIEYEQDLLIVAIATLNGLDIVFSDDEKTMINPDFTKAYQIVGLRKGLRTPNYVTFDVLLKSYVG